MKIGIITHYYKSTNYGGNLQAYALCKYINRIGFDAEQICWLSKNNSLKGKIITVYLKMLKIREFIFHNDAYKRITQRKKSILEFNSNKIKHSSIVYNNKNIDSIPDRYDVCITGSDQVWHPQAVNRAYLLDFSNKKIKKISYAASIAKDYLTENEKVKYRKALKSFKAISVREEIGVSIVQDMTNISVQLAVDPVFLLDKDEWDDIVQQKNKYGKYIFCYFLGNSLDHRKLASEFAKKKRLKIVTIPYLSDWYQECDINFGNIVLSDVSPEDWISLIKNAEFILTDSFHAMAFSIIFEKQFLVFERNYSTSMGSRIKSLANLFCVNDHYLDSKDKTNLNYALLVDNIKYKRENEEFKNLLFRSKKFLVDNLKGKE